MIAAGKRNRLKMKNRESCALPTGDPGRPERDRHPDDEPDDAESSTHVSSLLSGPGVSTPGARSQQPEVPSSGSC